MLEPQSFDDVRAYVEAMIETGEPFSAVEQVISASRLPEDAAAALWLVAWSLGDRRAAAERRPKLRLVR